MADHPNVFRMTPIKTTSATLLACFCAISAVFTPVAAETIYGDVQHDETIAPLPPQFQIGADYTEPPPAQRIEWFPVPPWMAGTWTKQGDYDTYALNMRNGQQMTQPVYVANVVTISFGHQIDAQGTVWNAEVLPFRADGFRGPKQQDHRFVTDESCLENTRAAVTLHMRSFIVTVDNKQKVKDNKQQDEMIRFTPSGPGAIRTDSSTRTYDANGKGTFQSRSYTTRTKTREFMPIAQLNGIDLRQSLAQYLTEHNMAYLVPQYGQAQSQPVQYGQQTYGAPQGAAPNYTIQPSRQYVHD